MASDILQSAYLRAIVVDYAERFIGTPYHWGGDDPMAGFDCSGFVVEVLQAVGILKHGRDYSANNLFELFNLSRVETGYAGCLAFWVTPESGAVHVMLMVDNERVIGAAGGDSGTTTTEDAIQQNAFIKLRPVGYRGGTLIIVDPFKGVLP